MIIEKEGLELIRPKRSLYCRRVRLGASSDSPGRFHLVFLHGTCAASAQYDSLLKALDDKSISCNCFLYDMVGCGKTPVVKDWEAYHTDESVKDLEAIVKGKVKGLNNNNPIILIGHSYAPTIIMRFIHQRYRANLHPNIKGCILLSTAIHGGPLPLPEGGHPIMNLPVFILKCLQPSLTNKFLELAFHSTADPAMVQEAKQANNQNNMWAAKAYHKHHQFASLKEAKSLHQLPVLLIHGQDDGIIPLAGGQHLADVLQTKCVVISEASHQVMQEQPMEVEEAIVQWGELEALK